MNEKEAICQARSLTPQGSQGFITDKLSHAHIFAETVKNRKVVGPSSLGSDLCIKTSLAASALGNSGGPGGAGGR